MSTIHITTSDRVSDINQEWKENESRSVHTVCGFRCACKVSSAHYFVICSEYIGTMSNAQYFPKNAAQMFTPPQPPYTNRPWYRCPDINQVRKKNERKEKQDVCRLWRCMWWGKRGSEGGQKGKFREWLKYKTFYADFCQGQFVRLRSKINSNAISVPISKGRKKDAQSSTSDTQQQKSIDVKEIMPVTKLFIYIWDMTKQLTLQEDGGGGGEACIYWLTPLEKLRDLHKQLFLLQYLFKYNMMV